MSASPDRLLENGEADSLIASVPYVDYSGNAPSSVNTTPAMSPEASTSPDRKQDDGTVTFTSGAEQENQEGEGQAGQVDAPTADANLPAMRRAFFTVLPLFMGYATMVTLQGHIKTQLNIGNNSSTRSYEFSFATSLIYFGNLLFRLMHNIIFSPFRPRIRVCIAYSCMAVATATLGVAYYIIEAKTLGYAYFAYLMAGVAIGTFESNLMSCITPLGHQTKVWAQYGIPLGFSGISIGAFGLFATDPGNVSLQMYVYLFVSLCNVAGIFFWMFAIPDIPFESTKQDLKAFWSDVKKFREWLPMMVPFACSLFVDMFGVSFFSALPLWIYDLEHMPLWPGCKTQISKDFFRVLYNLSSMIGDGSGRKIAYRTPKHIRPYFFLVLTVIGGGLVCSKVTILAFPGMLFLMHANGQIYSHTTKYVDDKVNRRFNLVSLSLWLFVGDVGSFVGANLVAEARVVIGGVQPLS